MPEANADRASDVRMEVRVAVLEDRVQRVQDDLNNLGRKVDEAVARIEKSVQEIKDRPNPVTEFLNKNWKSIVLVGAIILGANATLVDALQNILK